VITVFKAGFLGSGRFGSGIVVARLPDGQWSAPSAIGTVGGGFGGQIGFELTDFVFILNDPSAVRTFAQAGSITLGGNVSIAAGPVGRNAEAAGAASLKSVSGIFAYSKTKGLFAGVSLEGSVLIERRDANEKMYNRRVTARALLEGQVPVPPAADPLMRVLNSRVFSGVGGAGNDGIYNDIPVYDDVHDDQIWEGRRGSGMGEGQRSANLHSPRSPTAGSGGIGRNEDNYEYRDNNKPQKSATWQDDIYDRGDVHGVSRSNTYNSRANPSETFESLTSRGRSNTGFDSNYSDKSKPSRPTAPKPNFVSKKDLASNQAIAKFTFEGEQDGDLSFKKGEVITILKRTENATDWWTGRVGGKEGIFPR
jgi:lipid-binding SYLF domain-containing protein